MPPEADPQYLPLISLGVKWLVGTSLVGLVGFLVTIQVLLPNLSIERVIDKHNTLAFESRLLVKNLGRLPAYNIWANVFNCRFRGGGLAIGDITLTYNGQPTKKLGAGETMEVATLPQVGTTPGIQIEECEYRLMLEYQARLFFYRKKIIKAWHIELRPLGGDFTWQFTMQ